MHHEILILSKKGKRQNSRMICAWFWLQWLLWPKKLLKKKKRKKRNSRVGARLHVATSDLGWWKEVLEVKSNYWSCRFITDVDLDTSWGSFCCCIHPAVRFILLNKPLVMGPISFAGCIQQDCLMEQKYKQQIALL